MTRKRRRRTSSSCCGEEDGKRQEERAEVVTERQIWRGVDGATVVGGDVR